MLENEFRAYQKAINGPTWDQTTEEIVNYLGADIVFEGPQATGGTVYQYSMRQGVEQQADGKWYTRYVLGPIFTDTPEVTAAEQEAQYKALKDAEQSEIVRNDRNKRLKETDWTQVADAPVDKTLWGQYRQSLRDIPSQNTFPWAVQWPDKPEIRIKEM